MSKLKSEKETKKPAASEREKPADGGWRETVEGIAMAVILALLFRGFVAEAFVIPTGSMAPTLQGRHKDVECPKCGFQYQTSCSEEQRDDHPTGQHVYTTTCPICRYTQTLDPLEDPNEGSFSGDRIIVGKFCYDLAEPQRWDVIVFKFPGNAVQNYIKRLVGLPGETVRIVGGNVYVKHPSDSNFSIARKPPHKLEALLQIVDDTDYIAPQLIEAGWPSRWQPGPEASASSWEALDGGRAFVCKGKTGSDAWLRYRHLAPSHSDWETIELREQLPAGVETRRGQLISDFYAYNTPRYMPSDVSPGWSVLPRGRRWRSLGGNYRLPTDIPQRPGPGDPPPAEFLGQHWVDDLAVECVAEATSDQGELMLLLLRAGTKHICRINLADGKATLSMLEPDGSAKPFVGGDGKTAVQPSAQTRVKGAGRYRLRLSNCDHEMLLWVNGSVVTFDSPTTYESDDLVLPSYGPNEPGDLAPAGIGSRGAEVKFSQLRISRDKYYIATSEPGNDNDYLRSPHPEEIQAIFTDPARWESSGLFIPSNRGFEEFDLAAADSSGGTDQFLPLGDNSPQSYDARYWVSPYNEHHYVERDLLIGKALMIYWPHTWNRPVPYTPNFRKMGLIR